MSYDITVDQQDEDNIPETIEEVTNEPVMVTEKTVSTDELRIAKELDGYPHPFDEASVRVLEDLQQRGIAAKFEEGWARGFRWHDYMRQG